ncbi:MAG TPA: methyltransferase domain-containing protein [Gemmatimonadaceae bacterium]|nr:methyltransferase domain-containing protein [Gemmatimonadaceae bacterium]
MTQKEERFNYDSIADTYAERIDDAPHNALYERPAMLGVMPRVAGERILDAGCGNGWYAEQLLSRGADVDAIDASAVMVEHARARLSAQLAEGGEGRLSVQHADLMSALPFDSSRFGGIVCPLVMHYIADWRPTLREFRRVLRPDGWLLFSTHHPATEMVRYAPDNYFEIEHCVDTWNWLGTVEFYRRPLTEISSSLADSGFIIERLLEPIPTEAFRAVKPDSYAKLMRQPEFLIVLARPSRT